MMAASRRTIGAVTTSRADYGIYLPVMRKIDQDPELDLKLLVSGMHLAPEFGLTVRNIEADGFHIERRVEMLLSSDTPEGVVKSMGLGVVGFGQVFADFRPDILLVLGDRFEMFAAASAAAASGVPLAHIHGGEVTEGAIDESMRHSMTKLSHLHFASTEDYARRIMQLGEEAWRVTVSGAPSLDNLNGFAAASKDELRKEFGLTLDRPFLLVTYHPVTLELEGTDHQVGELFAALQGSGMDVVITYPNADAHGRSIIEMIDAFAADNPKIQVAPNLGTRGYFSLMKSAAAMVGNSSSGIIEAASFELPVVNVGSRQKGRVRGANVIDTGYGRAEISAAINQATSSGFKESLAGLVNPYGDGGAADRIVSRLKDAPLGSELIVKRFNDI